MSATMARSPAASRVSEGPGPVTWAAAALLLALGFACQWRIGFNNDNAWLLYAAGRSLDGARLYRDLIEINPPGILWLNRLIVSAARHAGADPVVVFRLVVFSLTLAGVWWTCRVARRGIFGAPAGVPLLVSIFVLDVLPVAWFGQREHFVLIFLLPWLWTTLERASGGEPLPVQAVVTGAIAGFGFGVKPQYLGVWVLMLGYLAVTRRSRRALLLPEQVAVAAAGTLYLAAVAAFSPEYLALVRSLGGLYADYRAQAPVRVAIGDFGGIVVLFALALHLAYRRNLRRSAWADVSALAAAGFYAGVLIQGKGFDYHYYPALACALVLMVATSLAADRAMPAGRRARRMSAALALVGGAPYALAAARIGAWGNDPEMIAYRRLERAVGPVRDAPILVLAPRSGYAFGLVTYAGARWVGRFPCLWIPTVLYRRELADTTAVRFRDPADMSRAEQWFRSAVVGDAIAARPAVVLVARPARGPAGSEDAGIDLLRYFSSDSLFRDFMGGYVRVGEAVGYDIYRPLGGREGSRPVAP